MMHQNWWKYLGVLLLLYTFTAGMLVPLKPGINYLSPNSARTGDSLTVKVQGYNTFYTRAQQPLRAWLKLDDEQALAAQSIQVNSDQELSIQFDIPSYLPVRQRVQDFALVLDSDYDGPAVLPSAVFVTQDSIDPEMARSVWVNAPIKDLSNRNKMTYPFRNILYETIRNTYFHVSLWLAMVLLFMGAVYQSARHLRSADPAADAMAKSLTAVGVFYGVLGIITGMIWAKYTWNAYWSWDVKQNMTAISLLIYLAYFVLRSSFNDPQQQGRISAAYNIFAFAAMIPLIYVIPRMTDSLHPGNGGNPAFGSEDLDNTMRMVFYPAVIGWTLLGLWMGSLLYRAELLQARILDRE